MPADDPLGECRSCGSALVGPLLDLGAQPSADALTGPGPQTADVAAHPLALALCPACGLVQLAFGDPPGAPSHGHGTAFSTTAMAHARGWHAALHAVASRDRSRPTVDVAAGSGHLLLPFHDAGLPVWALEADPNQAAACRANGIPTLDGVLGLAAADRLVDKAGLAGLVLVSHALAHLDDLDDAVAGIERLMAPGGAAVIEFHHLATVVSQGQFDVVCHAHRSYASLAATQAVLARAGLDVVDVELEAIHGGSLRIRAVRRADQADGAGSTGQDGAVRVASIVAAERAAGLDRVDGFAAFASGAVEAAGRLRAYLESCRAARLTVAGYGAPSRAATLLNTAGITAELLPFTVDRSPDKQGRSLPGCGVPILAPDALERERPDRILILPWTLEQEIVGQLAGARAWGAQFVIPLPELREVG